MKKIILIFMFLLSVNKIVYSDGSTDESVNNAIEKSDVKDSFAIDSIDIMSDDYKIYRVIGYMLNIMAEDNTEMLMYAGQLDNLVEIAKIEELLTFIEEIPVIDKDQLIHFMKFVDPFYYTYPNYPKDSSNEIFRELDMKSLYYYTIEADKKIIEEVITADIVETAKVALLSTYGEYLLFECEARSCSNRFEKYMDDIYKMTGKFELYNAIQLAIQSNLDKISEEYDISKFKLNIIGENSTNVINNAKYTKGKNILSLKKDNYIVNDGKKYYLIDEKKSDEYDVKVVVSNDGLKELYLYVKHGEKTYIERLNKNRYFFDEEAEILKFYDAYLTSYNLDFVDVNGDGTKEIIVERLFLNNENEIYIGVVQNDGFYLSSLRDIDVSKYYNQKISGRVLVKEIIDDYGNNIVVRENIDPKKYVFGGYLVPSVGFVIDDKVYFRIKNVANYEVMLDENLDVKLKVIDPETDPLNLSVYY